MQYWGMILSMNKVHVLNIKYMLQLIFGLS